MVLNTRDLQTDKHELTGAHVSQPAPAEMSGARSLAAHTFLLSSYTAVHVGMGQVTQINDFLSNKVRPPVRELGAMVRTPRHGRAEEGGQHDVCWVAYWSGCSLGRESAA